ncbi:MAG TPA: ParB/RepB/Spo0J family partition protein [Rectinema sp.]|nr:ParB/RepB/Spo0J family partition protein [Rectinema sp.]HNY98936.1 ParB/RepB/Spo0J family partition protein [Rectinema sp.]HOE75858.1 ParB/RepB/Spo0J family partition protein [Rectinema sp.]HOH05304.1 ParB/RepB/Spo0J family partition protein [Rectinema sp.]HOM92836.1 ParB/RepB/Spo0J family partition protein [Rectinema sp.]
MAKFGLGKGLGALIPEHQQFFEQSLEEQSASIVKLVSIEDLVPNPDQPRKTFTQESLDDLAESIRRHGLLQPLLVHQEKSGKYIIIAGERRYRAAQIAGLEQLPVIVRNQDDENHRIELSLVENIQREDLDPIEEAQAYAKLMEITGATQEGVAEMVGKSRVAVANTIRLLKLPEDMQVQLKQGIISPGHARALLSIEEETERRRLFEHIQLNNLSVRQAEQEAQKIQGLLQGKRTKTRKQLDSLKTIEEIPLDPHLKELMEKLIERLGTKVEISGSIDTGTIKIHYFSREDLERIYEVLKIE